LRPGSNGHSLAVKEVGRRTRLIDVRSIVLQDRVKRVNYEGKLIKKSYIIACHKKSNAIRSTIIALSANLHLIAHVCYQSRDRQSIIMGIAVV
jgi:hypothetical protein